MIAGSQYLNLPTTFTASSAVCSPREAEASQLLGKDSTQLDSKNVNLYFSFA